jgi:hypothetical protein
MYLPMLWNDFRQPMMLKPIEPIATPFKVGVPDPTNTQLPPS